MSAADGAVGSFAPTPRRYAAFADLEARGESPLYEEWARGVAADRGALALIEELPASKRQPNLVFAAARVCGVPLAGYDRFADRLRAHWQEVREVVLQRSTQTNEAARCTALVHALREVREPIALLEIGASAGLCLYPDRYRYRFRLEGGGTAELGPPSDAVIDCAWSGAAPPSRLPEVAWRAGMDLHPVDVRDEDEARWLEALVWPEHEARRIRLRAAIEQARRDPPLLLPGDALQALPGLAASAPPDARLVVVASAVLAYLPLAVRNDLVELVRALEATWISIEGVRVLPDVAARLPLGVDPGGDFVVARDGAPIGLIGPHGQRYRALPPR